VSDGRVIQSMLVITDDENNGQILEDSVNRDGQELLIDAC